MAMADINTPAMLRFYAIQEKVKLSRAPAQSHQNLQCINIAINLR